MAAIFVTVVALPAHARCRVGNVAAIPVAIDNNQLLARGAIDGHPVRVLIDSGSYMILIWRSKLGDRVVGNGIEIMIAIDMTGQTPLKALYLGSVMISRAADSAPIPHRVLHTAV
jgi:hypothetical protein